ncbi:hypothetical protein HPU229334_05655 [Helicobacter pullorum]|uniref:Uncharacterized protein n=1 Tax=Helicobacter pullorum TaxID=35818 RepID=A0A0N1MPT2_9HELI|nr:hypothetical protein HPU229334_05655 [Helicobacter pullorum]
MKKINKLYNNKLNFIDINKIKYQELKSINLNQPNLPNPLKILCFYFANSHKLYIAKSHKRLQKGHFKQNILNSYSKKRQNRFMRFLL